VPFGLRIILHHTKLTPAMLDTIDPSLKRTPSRYRVANVEDIPWMLSVGYRVYGPYDPGPVLTYLVALLRNNDAQILRTDKAISVATLFKPPWSSVPECNVVALCAIDGAVWDAVRLLKATIIWARARGCAKWWFGSETNTDISAIAKRVGGVRILPRYRIDL
jgi:hypothetical protein